MTSALKCAAIASVFMLAAGSMAGAQTYTANPQGTYNTGNQGHTTSTPGYSGYSSPGANKSNQANWASGMQGSSTPYGGQAYSRAGYGNGSITTYQQAEQELGRYGYNNVRDLRSMQGWSADAMKNGERVHVILGDNGLVATFPGS